MNYEPLNNYIAEQTKQYWTFPSSFSDISEAYKEKYGKKGWIGKLATAFTGKVPPSQSGYAKGTEGYKQANREYNTARRQIERHATGQYKSFSKPGQEKLAEIGKTLEPIKKDAPPNGLTLTITFGDPGDKNHAYRARQRTTAAIHLDHATAVEYINQEQPTYDFLFDEWFDDAGDEYGEDGSYEAEIYAVSAA